MIILKSTSSIVISLTSWWLDLYNSSASSSSSTLKLNKDENVHRYAVIGEKERKEREIKREIEKETEIETEMDTEIEKETEI